MKNIVVIMILLMGAMMFPNISATSQAKVSANTVKKAVSSSSKLTVNTIESIKLKDVKYWAYQINGSYTDKEIKNIVDSKYDMVVLEPTRTSTDELNYDAAAMVSRIKDSKASDGKAGKLAIAYINIGEAESWRWYWQKISNPVNKYDIVLAPDPDGWEDNYLTAFWKEKWKDIIIYGSETAKGLKFKSAIDQAITDGFDGIYLDWVEAYAEDKVIKRAQKDGVEPKKEMIKFLSQIRTYTKERNKDFLVIQQNASSIVAQSNEAFDYIDAIAQEGVWFDGTAYDDWADPTACDIRNNSALTNYYLVNLKKFLKQGKPVFNIEYAEKYAKNAYEISRKNGYIPYCTRRALSKLSNTVPYR